MTAESMRLFKISLTVPATHVEIVKDALFAAGAGRVGAYDRCAWQTSGSGQFRPLPGSNAFIGEIGAVERVEEYRVELVCVAGRLSAALAALVAAHPYETPAYEYWEINPPCPCSKSAT